MKDLAQKLACYRKCPGYVILRQFLLDYLHDTRKPCMSHHFSGICSVRHAVSVHSDGVSSQKSKWPSWQHMLLTSLGIKAAIYLKWQKSTGSLNVGRSSAVSIMLEHRGYCPQLTSLKQLWDDTTKVSQWCYWQRSVNKLLNTTFKTTTECGQTELSNNRTLSSS